MVFDVNLGESGSGMAVVEETGFATSGLLTHAELARKRRLSLMFWARRISMFSSSSSELVEEVSDGDLVEIGERSSFT